MIPAHNVTIIFHSSTNITYDDSSLYYTENSGDVRIKNDGPNKLIISAPRLVGSGGQIALTEILAPPPILGSHVLSGIFFSGNFGVLVAYEEGSSNRYYNIDRSSIKQASPTILNNVEGLLIILGLFLAIFFYFVPQIYRLVKNLTRDSYRSRIYSQIIRELIVVLETIRTDPATTKIFPADLIDYQEINTDTRSFFYNYEDLRLIGEFYAKLRKRDNGLSTEPNYLTPTVHNAECYRQGLNVLKNIKWRKYGILTTITKKREIISYTGEDIQLHKENQ